MSRDQDELYGDETTPVEFQLKVREFAELEENGGDPNEYAVDIRLGRIEAEDDELVVGGELGACVARFNINDQYTVWIDREGNYQAKVGGIVKHEYHKLVETTYNTTFKQKVRGVLDSSIQTRRETVFSTDTQVVGRDRSVTIGGRLTEIVAKDVSRQGGRLLEEYKGVERTIKGSVSESMTGAHEKRVGDNRNVTVGGDSAETVAGSKKTVIGKADDPNPLTKGYQIYLYNGVFSVHDFAGKIVFTSGTPEDETALARVTLKPTGAVVIKPNLAGTVKMEVNNFGVSISTPAGEMSIDNAGTVQLGPGPVRGHVVTTISHPFDLVTGAPTLGVSSVSAGGAPTPGFGVLPSTFVPDLTP